MTDKPVVHFDVEDGRSDRRGTGGAARSCAEVDREGLVALDLAAVLAVALRLDADAAVDEPDRLPAAAEDEDADLVLLLWEIMSFGSVIPE